MTVIEWGGAGPREPSTHHGPSRMIVSVVMAIALTACGGSDSGDGTGDEASAATTGPAPTEATTTATESEEPAATTTEAMDEGEEPSPEVSTATVSVAGETYTFAATGFIAERCDPDFFGGAQVVLQMVDENGEAMVVADQIQALDLVLIPNDPANTAMDVPTTDPDREWIANSESMIVEGSQIDDWSIDGTRIQGTATFVSSTGEGPEQGTFEVVCAEE